MVAGAAGRFSRIRMSMSRSASWMTHAIYQFLARSPPFEASGISETGAAAWFIESVRTGSTRPLPERSGTIPNLISAILTIAIVSATAPARTI